MFQNFKHIDTAFQFIRIFCLFFLLGTLAVSFYTVQKTNATLRQNQQRIYVLLNGKLLEAQAVERTDSLSVEIKDHVKMFHFFFYTLEADEEVNNRHITAAMYLADSSAFQAYKSLQESGYYSRIISNNITQEVIDYDSIAVDVTHSPYYFKYYGKIRLTRPTSVLTRSLITEGFIRILGSVSTKNPHGMLIERWKVSDNRDLSSQKR